MPSPHSRISAYELSQLKEAVEKHFGFAVRTKTDCDKLADFIEDRTKKYISVNTLRRFFDVMPSGSSPSLETLNVLSNFCGFNDFYEFQRAVVFDRARKSNDLTIDAVDDLQQVLGESEQFYTTFNWLMLLAFHESNTDFLKNIFKAKGLQNRDDYPRGKLMSLMFSFATQMRSHSRLADDLIPHYAKLPEAQQLYFEWFVDYDCLNLGHHKVVRAYANERPDEEAQLFSLCLLFLHHFWLMEKNECKILIEKINAIHLKPEMHPFPVGRKFACNILYQHYFKNGIERGLRKSIEDWEKRLPRNGNLERNLPSFHLMVVEAFSMAGLNEEVLQYTELAQRNYRCELDEYSKGVIIPLAIYRAGAMTDLTRKEEAKALLRSVDPTQLDDYNRRYYQMNYYKILASTEPRGSADFTKYIGEAKRIARQHKFRFFENH
ncbi:MAG: hypothetical protein JST69_06765 [Bacteroidetes bacterium]|nr:hypothetical protein [Bacteroidota bacterium]